MPMSALTGSRLRERRIALGLLQADLAGMAGISASYLNPVSYTHLDVYKRQVVAGVLLWADHADLGGFVPVGDTGCGAGDAGRAD